MKDIVRSVVVFGLVAGLAACSHYSEELSSLDKQMGGAQTASIAAPQAIQPAAGGPEAQRSFLQYLARDYYDLARAENDTAFDYKSSRAFTGKAATAANSNWVIPSKLSSYDLTPARSKDLGAGRAALITALKTENTSGNAQSLARAQSRFDCWIEQAEEATDDAHFAQCRSEFESAMAALVTPAAGNELPGSAYAVAFAKESAVPELSSQKDIDYVSTLLKDPKNEAYSVTLTGHTSFGAPEGADALTNARIAAIQKALLEKGVRADQVKPVLEPTPSHTAPDSAVTMTVVAPAGGEGVTTNFVPITPVPVPSAQ